MPANHVTQTAETDLEIIVEGNNTFALELYRRLKQVDCNLFFAPFSICSALAMTYAGARGATETQMAEALHFTLPQVRLHPAFAALSAHLDAMQANGNVQLNIANSLWPDVGYPFLETFLALAREFYGVTITPVDYVEQTEVARQVINAWVEEKTDYKIKELILPNILNPLSRLTLVNAIYFKGNWASQFDPQSTITAPFHVTAATVVEVAMMQQTQKFAYAETSELQVLELPYIGDEIAMLLFLPTTVDGLANLQAVFSLKNVERWMQLLYHTEVEVKLPRFKLTADFRLDKTLQAMGMPDAFDEEKANFAGMDGQENWLYIGAALHKAFIEVNEEGTEAAAASAVIMLARGISKNPVFCADHPFVFVIVDKRAGSILFCGQVVDPTAG
ncbi:MAG: serpin family protein [Caldilineaceae bacterium]